MENTNKKQKLKLLENKLRKMVREELTKKKLNEEPEDRDLDYLYSILKSSGPKISRALTNLEKIYGTNPKFHQIKKAWDTLAFGYGDFYHLMKQN